MPCIVHNAQPDRWLKIRRRDHILCNSNPVNGIMCCITKSLSSYLNGRFNNFDVRCMNGVKCFGFGAEYPCHET